MKRAGKKLVRPIEDIDKSINWVYHLIKEFDPNDKSYHIVNQGLTPATTWLMDRIIEEIEKRYFL